MSRTLILDGQIFQTPAWHRGMGQYSLELMSALSKLNQEKEYWEAIDIVLSRNLDISERVEEELVKRLPNVTIHKLNLMRNTLSNAKRHTHNVKTINKHISSNVKGKVDFLILSLMQSEILPVFPDDPLTNKVLLVYDLIPLMFADTYLADPITRQIYLSKLDEFLKADLFLTISKTVANNLAQELGISPTRIKSIDGGPINHFKKLKPYKIKKPYILMPTGNDLRKNNTRGILAFKEFNKQSSNEYMLVITSNFTEMELQELSSLSPNVVFTGNIESSQLGYLYENSEALFFPTEYEGLGLPILEAVKNNKPIACADITVFTEMSKDAFCYFDPKSIKSMAKSISTVTAPSYKIDYEEYKRLLEIYTWENTAQSLSDYVTNNNLKTPKSKKSLNFIGPNPTSGSIGMLIQKSHAEIMREFNDSYYMEESGTGRGLYYLRYLKCTYPVDKVFSEQFKSSETPVYYLDNTPKSSKALFAALTLPGIIILVDKNLDKAWNGMLDIGLISESRLKLEKKIDSVCQATGVNMVGSLLNYQKLVLVFDSELASSLNDCAQKIGNNVKVKVIKRPSSQLVYKEVVRAKHTDIVYGYDDYATELKACLENL